MKLNPPLFISSRLMAAVTIDGDTGGIINLEHTGQNAEGRQTYRWLVEAHDHAVLGEGDDLASGVGDEVDYVAMMASLLSFLGADAESYRHHMGDGPGESDDPDMFPPAVTEWAYMNSDMLAILHEVLAPEWTACFYCGEPIKDAGGGTWVDTTESDVCSGDDDDNRWNEDGTHSPIAKTNESEIAYPTDPDADDPEIVWFDDDDEPEDPFVDDDPEFPRGTHVTVDGHAGIAFWVIKVSPDQAIVRMVGDDRDFTVDRDDLTLLDREAFCGECGQVGCTHDGLDRSDV